MQKRVREFLADKYKRWGLILFVSIFTVFCFTVAKYHVSIADSDEFSTIGYLLGVAHAPGYPVYILILYIFEHFIPFGSIAFRANLTSVLFDSLTVLFVYMISLETLRYVKLKGIDERIKKKKYKVIWYFYEDRNFENLKIAISIVSALMLAFSFMFWFYTDVAEVFALNNLFTVILIYITVRLTRVCLSSRFEPYENRNNEEGYLFKARDKSRDVFRYLLVLDIVAALALAHLQTIVIIYPAVLFYTILILIRGNYWKVLVKPKNLILFTVVFIAVFFAPFLMMEWFNSLHASVSWELKPGLQGLYQYITRQNYNIGGTNAYVHSLDVTQGSTDFSIAMQSLMDNFTVIPLVLICFGFLSLLLRNRRLFLYFAALVLIAVILFGIYNPFPISRPDISNIAAYFGDIAEGQRQYIMGNVILALLIAPGLYELFKLILISSFREKAVEGVKTVFKPSGILFTSAFILLIAFGGIGFEIQGNFNVSNLNDFYYIQKYTHDELMSLKPHAVLICFSDISCFGDLFEQQVDHTRPDVTIVTFSYIIRYYYLNHLHNLQLFYYPYSPDFIGDIISWNLYQGRPVYVSDIDDSDVNYLGADGSAFYLLPNGYALQVVKTIPTKDTATYSYQAALAYSQYFNTYAGGTNSKNYWYRTLIGFLAKPMSLDGYLNWEEGNPTKAVQDAKIEYQMGSDYEPKSQEMQAISTYETQKGASYPGESIASSEELLALAVDNRYTNHQDSFVYALHATFEDPLNIQARLIVAYWYANNHALIQNSIQEYENVLKLDPGNLAAIKGISALEHLN